MRPSNRKHKFVRGSCERKSVQEKLVHKIHRGAEISILAEVFKPSLRLREGCVLY